MRNMPKTTILLAALILICSCNKNDKKYCWNCTVTYYSPLDTSLPATSYSTVSFCDKTLDDMAKMQSLSFESSKAGYWLEKYSNCGKK